MRIRIFSFRGFLCAVACVAVYAVFAGTQSSLLAETERSPLTQDVAPLDIEAPGPEWQALLDTMRATERVAAPFVEHRSFAFRKEPKQYAGVFRKESDGRISLAYTEPEAMALHIGDDFAYYRKGDGSIRRIPESKAQQASIRLLPKLLNFDLHSMAQQYAIAGGFDGESWLLVFTAKADVDVPYREMRINGLGAAVESIELLKSSRQKVRIQMGDPVYPDFYLPHTKEAYFFSLESNE